MLGDGALGKVKQMSVICSLRHSTKNFTYHKDTKTLTIEISTLTQGRGPAFGQVYDDACDEGFVLVSHKTGREITFVNDGLDRDPEGDTAGWRFAPIDRKTGRRDRTLDLKVLVIND
jgi:hypothetical protein